ncbi:hypothetical protein SESBI_25667 [Sesbania bispinosa]|nr:hypothetical protein SESBI_25667 [Sesbania bispinosa]
MVKVRVLTSDSHRSDSSSSLSSESSVEPIPRSVTFMVWTQFPPPRANPLDTTGRKWMDNVKPPVRPFPAPPSSGDDFLKDSLISPVVRLEEALLFHDAPKTPTHTVGPSLHRSRLIRGEFPWSPCNYVTRASFTSCWAEWVSHVFANDLPFVKVTVKAGIAGAVRASPRFGVFLRVEDLNCVVQRWSRVTHTFFTSWGEFTPTLEDVHILMRLPLFRDHDASSGPVDSHIIDRAKELKATTIESAKYSREFLARLSVGPSSVSDTPHRKVRGTGNMLLPGQRKVARESLKYTYATWISFSEAMKVVLFQTSDPATPFDAAKFVPPDRSGRVLDLWVAYHARLRNSVRRYEQQDSMQVFPNVKIMCKDPYFVTTALKKTTKTAAAASQPKGKKRKPTTSKKPSTISSIPEKDSPPLLVPQTESPKASADKAASGEAAASDQVSSSDERVIENEQESNHEGQSSAAADDCTVERSKESTHKEIIFSKGANSPSASSVQTNAPQLVTPFSFVPPPSTAHSLLTSGMTHVSALMSEEDARMLSEFFERHPGFLVSDSNLPSAFLRPAYALFSELLRALQSHSMIELIGVLKERLLSDLNALSLFGFKGDWLNKLSCHLAQPVPPAAFEDLSKVTQDVHLLEQRVAELQQHMEAVKAELDQKVAELDRLRIREKEIRGARASLDAMLDFLCLLSSSYESKGFFARNIDNVIYQPISFFYVCL